MDTPQKAYISVEPFSAADKIECWFNPKEFSLTKTNKWEVKPKAGSPLPDAQFTGSDSQKISLDLLFDDTDSPSGDVRTICGKLFKMMEVDGTRFSGGANSGGSGGAGNKNSGRPPTVEFGWGNLITFKAVCDSLTVQYTLFKPDGTPIRANAKLQLTQVAPATMPTGGQMKRQNPTTTGVGGLRTHVVRDGDSLQSIAYAAYGDATRWRPIADENGIDDPTRLRRGSVLTIPRLDA